MSLLHLPGLKSGKDREVSKLGTYPPLRGRALQ